MCFSPRQKRTKRNVYERHYKERSCWSKFEFQMFFLSPSCLSSPRFIGIFHLCWTMLSTGPCSLILCDFFFFFAPMRYYISYLLDPFFSSFYGACRWCERVRRGPDVVCWRFHWPFSSAGAPTYVLCVMKYIRPTLLDRNDDASSRPLSHSLLGAGEQSRRKEPSLISLCSPSSGYITHQTPFLSLVFSSSTFAFSILLLSSS